MAGSHRRLTGRHRLAVSAMRTMQRRLRSDVRPSCLPHTLVITVWDDDADTVAFSYLTHESREVAERFAVELVLANLDQRPGRTIYGWLLANGETRTEGRR